MSGELGERGGGGYRAVRIAEAGREAGEAGRGGDRERVHRERFAVARERVARDVRARRVARLRGDPLEQHREAQLEGEAGSVVGRDRAQGLERGDHRSARAGLAPPRGPHLAPDERLEGAGIGRVELEDPGVRGLRVADRELPLLERRQPPERAEARADVDQRFPLAGEDAREGRPSRSSGAIDSRGAQRRRVVRARLDDRFEERRRAREIGPRLGEEPREIERDRALDLRQDAALEPGRHVRRERAEPLLRGARAVADREGSRRRPPREHAREPLDRELVVRRLGERLRVHLDGRQVVERRISSSSPARTRNRARLRAPARRRQVLVGCAQRAIVSGRREDARDLGVGDGVRRVEHARGLQRLDGVVRRAQAGLLELRER